MRKLVRRAIGLGIVAGVGYAAWKLISPRSVDTGIAWEPQPFPSPPRPVPSARDGEVTSRERWIDAVDGICPASHPVKAKLASGIFHVPGSANYDRTNADRCYIDAATAEADGLRQSKR